MKFGRYITFWQVIFTTILLAGVSLAMWGLIVLLDRAPMIPGDKDAPVFNFLTVTVGIAVALVGGIATIALAVSSLKISLEQSEIGTWSVLQEELRSLQEDVLKAEELWETIVARSFALAKIVAKYQNKATLGSSEEFSLSSEAFKAAFLEAVSRALKENREETRQGRVRDASLISKTLPLDAYEHFSRDIASSQIHYDRIAGQAVEASQNLSNAVLEYFEFIDDGRRGHVFERILARNASARRFTSVVAELIGIYDPTWKREYENTISSAKDRSAGALDLSTQKVLFNNLCHGTSIVMSRSGVGTKTLLKEVNFRGYESVPEFNKFLPVINSDEALFRLPSSTSVKKHGARVAVVHDVADLPESDKSMVMEILNKPDNSFANALVAMASLIDVSALSSVIKDYLLDAGSREEVADRLARRYGSSFKSKGIGRLRLEDLTTDVKTKNGNHGSKLIMKVAPAYLRDGASSADQPARESV